LVSGILTGSQRLAPRGPRRIPCNARCRADPLDAWTYDLLSLASVRAQGPGRRCRAGAGGGCGDGGDDGDDGDGDGDGGGGDLTIPVTSFTRVYPPAPPIS
jgi:hypothetical protein